MTTAEKPGTENQALAEIREAVLRWRLLRGKSSC